MADTKEALPVVAWMNHVSLPGETQANLPHVFFSREQAAEESEPLVCLLDATAAIAELRAEVERLRADAERLDWLARRDLNGLCLGYNEDAPGPYTVNGSTGRTFREAIDASRAGASGGAE